MVADKCQDELIVFRDQYTLYSGNGEYRKICGIKHFNLNKGYCTRSVSFSGQLFRIFDCFYLFCFVVDICDLVHDVEALFHRLP